MNQEREKMLAREPISSLIWKLSLPAIVGMLVQAAYNLVDTIYIGHGVGALGIGALSVSFPLQMIIGGTGAMLGMGSASVISRNLGAKKYDRAETAFGNNLLAIVGFGGAIALAGTLFTSSILGAFGATSEILPYARDYMSVIFAGSPLIIFSISMNNVIRSEGAARVAMYSMLIGALTNIILDPVFIFVLGMGIRGAAIATILARFSVIAWIAWYYSTGRSILTFHMKNLRPDPGILGEIIVIGLPALVRHAATSFVFGFVNRLAAFYGGNMAVALFGVVNRLVMFSGMPMVGISQGMQPILGYSYGARYYHRAREVIWKSAFLATAYTSFMAVIFLTFPRGVLSIFTHDAQLLAMGPHTMRLMTMGFFFVGFQMIGGTLFQAIGKATPSFVLNTARQILFLVPILLILPKYIGIDGVWLSFSISDILSTLITLAVVIPQMNSLNRAELVAEGE